MTFSAPRTTFLCFLVFSLFFVLTAGGVCQAAGDRALLVSSYHPGFPTFFQQIAGVKSVFDAADVSLDVEYMDSKRFHGQEDIDTFYQTLRRKTRQLAPYDVVVTADDNALTFLLEHKTELFAETPAVFFGVNNVDLARGLSGNAEYTGVIESISLWDTLETIWTLRPETTLHVLVDATPSGQGDLVNFKRQMLDRPGNRYEVLSLAELTWEECAKHLEALPSQDSVLLLSAYHDRDDVTLSFEDSLRWLLSHANNPIFHLWSHGVGQGLVGGKVISHYEQGHQAARLALKILRGTPPRELPVIEGDTANVFLFDYPVLERHGLDPSLLPEEATLLNEPHLLPKHLKNVLLIGGTFLILVLFFCFLLVLYAARVQRARSLLETAHQRLSIHIENSPLAVIEWENGRHIQVWSKHAETIFGWKAEELLGKNWEDFNFIHPDDKEKTRERIMRLFDGTETYNTIGNRNLRKDGKVIYCQWYNSSIHDEEGNILSILSQVADVTELKESENNLILAKEQAEAANLAKSAFLANMSHEIRTPMNGIMGMLELLQSLRMSVEHREYISAAIQSAQRMTRLLSDILDISRVEANQLTIQPAPMNVHAVVNQACELFKPTAHQSDIKLSCTIDPAIPKHLIGDAARLQQVLTNVVGNALKFTREGSIDVGVYRIGKQTDHTVRLLFSVADTGIGIPDKKIAALFRPFSQVSEGYHRDHQGAGLGLSICKRIIELMDGEICLESHEGRGTTVFFSLEFPLSRTTPRTEPPLAASPALPETLTILVAEDEEVNRFAITTLLKKKGHTVHATDNGASAVEMLKSGGFDVVFMDIQMAVMDGLEATRVIRRGGAGEEVRDIPIVAMTAYAMAGDREAFLVQGMTDYLAKPISLESLEDLLKRLGKKDVGEKTAPA